MVSRTPPQRTSSGRPWSAVSFSIAWQIAVVLTFLVLFWTLASISPYTVKTFRFNLIAGEIVLILLWVFSLVFTFRLRQPGSIHFRHWVLDHPQIWVVAIYLALSSLDLGVLPMCDNGAYFKSVLDAVRNFNFVLGDSLKAMKLYGHPAYAYAAYMMLGQFLDYGNFVVANVQVRLLSASAILAFAGIVEYLFPGQERRWTRLLITALFSFIPLVYGVSLTVSTDHAVLVFLCLTIWFYVLDAPILTLASGVMLCFSKEAGALLYGSWVVGLYAVLLPYRTRGEMKSFLKKALENSYVWVPLALFAIYLMVDGQLWMFNNPHDLLQNSSNFISLSSSTAYDKTVQIFLANFNWVIWGLIGLGLITGIQLLMDKKNRPWRMSEQSAWFLVFILTLAPFFVANYLLNTWNNPRYLVPLCLFEMLFLLKAVETIWQRFLLRTGVLAVSLVLLFASCFKTFDPVLFQLFPTFEFGDHRMSFYNSQRTLCDLTLYDREFVYYNRLFDRFLQASHMNPTVDSFVFFTDDYLLSHNIAYEWTGTDWTGTLYINPETMTRTYNPQGNFPLRFQIFPTEGPVNASSLPSHAFTIQTFWRQSLQNEADATIQKYYRVVRQIHVDEDGYTLDGYELMLKNH
jgi:hypothetical protein